MEDSLTVINPVELPAPPRASRPSDRCCWYAEICPGRLVCQARWARTYEPTGGMIPCCQRSSPAPSLFQPLPVGTRPPAVEPFHAVVRRVIGCGRRPHRRRLHPPVSDRRRSAGRPTAQSAGEVTAAAGDRLRRQANAAGSPCAGSLPVAGRNGDRHALLPPGALSPRRDMCYQFGRDRPSATHRRRWSRSIPDGHQLSG